MMQGKGYNMKDVLAGLPTAIKDDHSGLYYPAEINKYGKPELFWRSKGYKTYDNATSEAKRLLRVARQGLRRG